jgi:hypothetical protein
MYFDLSDFLKEQKMKCRICEKPLSHCLTDELRERHLKTKTCKVRALITQWYFNGDGKMANGNHSS